MGFLSSPLARTTWPPSALLSAGIERGSFYLPTTESRSAVTRPPIPPPPLPPTSTSKAAAPLPSPSSSQNHFALMRVLPLILRSLLRPSRNPSPSNRTCFKRLCGSWSGWSYSPLGEGSKLFSRAALTLPPFSKNNSSWLLTPRKTVTLTG